ncbi:MAG: polysaccharide biosynthesis/export family protein [Methylobacteriaceae bacterium]|nr:polysaccharide biosynthesis/export family protein [Methylobacteriaceae bacterium]MBV9243696.1 polysaccharide biosynthesis/export family protein [Methylobacteriaceae bacterium]
MVAAISISEFSQRHTSTLPARFSADPMRQLQRTSCGLALGLFCSAIALIASAVGAEIPGDGSTYNLAPGDRINIAVFEQAGLSGDVFVDSAGHIRLPLVGDVSIAEMTVDEAEQQIAKRLASFVEHPIVSVRVTEFRPINVMGDVRAPGSYVFRYGSVVASAVALAGGYSADQPRDGARAEYLLADEHLRVLLESRRALQVRIARLEAQLSGAADFDLAKVPDVANDSSLADVVASEKAILKGEASALDQELSIMRAQQPLLEAQIASIKEQANAEAVQLQLIQAHIQDYDKLLKNGLGNRYTGIELQREEARNKGNISGYAAQMTALHLAIGEMQLRIDQAESAYKQRIATQLSDARTSLQQTEAAIPAAREIRELRLQLGQMTTSTGSDNRKHDFVIVRRRGRESQEIPATETTPIQPGDIIKVRELPSSSPPLVTMMQPDDRGTKRLPAEPEASTR